MAKEEAAVEMEADAVEQAPAEAEAGEGAGAAEAGAAEAADGEPASAKAAAAADGKPPGWRGLARERQRKEADAAPRVLPEWGIRGGGGRNREVSLRAAEWMGQGGQRAAGPVLPFPTFATPSDPVSMFFLRAPSLPPSFPPTSARGPGGLGCCCR